MNDKLSDNPGTLYIDFNPTFDKHTKRFISRCQYAAKTYGRDLCKDELQKTIFRGLHEVAAYMIDTGIILVGESDGDVDKYANTLRTIINHVIDNSVKEWKAKHNPVEK
jgi:hypothetical protein